MWNNLLQNIIEFNHHSKKNPPATNAEVFEVESKLGVKLPTQIKELLSVSYGDDYFLLSTN